MNPEDFTFDPNYHYDYFNNYYYDKTMGWSNCNAAYRIIEDNRILLNVNYIGVKTIYIERPNCEDLINIKELNPAVIVDNNLKTIANYADSFDDTEGKEKGKEITIWAKDLERVINENSIQRGEYCRFAIVAETPREIRLKDKNNPTVFYTKV